jgi:PAS domain S-box-containing protein
MPKTSDTFFESFDYFDALFNKTMQNSVLLMDAEGIVVNVNGAFTKCFGYKEKDIIGKHLRVFFTEEDQNNGLPDKEVQNVLHLGQCNDNNYFVHKNKTKIWVSGESILVKNKAGEESILKVIQDIHSQKISQISLHQANEFNENILRSIGSIVIVLDEDLNIIKTNRNISELIKSSTEYTDLIDFSDLIKPYDIKNGLVHKIKQTFKTGKGFLNMELEIETTKGEKRILDISGTIMQEANDDRNVLLVADDITVHKYSERQREDIIGFVAHELRNPLANIVLCNELMGELITENDPEAVMDLLTRSKNNVMRLNRMIAELYDATKVGSGNMQLDTAEFNFKDMITEAIDTVEVLQPDYKIILNGKANIKVKGDRYRLIQVVTNYLSNGIKYSQGSTQVELRIQYDDKIVTVSVKDRGLGISKEQLPYIFNRFFRAEKTKNLEGVGLGLYLCRQIIQAHNGNVWAESEEGKGSIFYFSIPINT